MESRRALRQRLGLWADFNAHHPSLARCFEQEEELRVSGTSRVGLDGRTVLGTQSSEGEPGLAGATGQRCSKELGVGTREFFKGTKVLRVVLGVRRKREKAVAR